MIREPLSSETRRKPRKVITGYAACGSNGKPWCHMRGPSAPVGQLPIFETHRQALEAHGTAVHRVTIYIEREPSKWLK